MISVNDFQNGLRRLQSMVNYWRVVEFQHVKPGKGWGFGPFSKIHINLRNGRSVHKKHSRAGEK